jgi:hypothetical protein
MKSLFKSFLSKLAMGLVLLLSTPVFSQSVTENQTANKLHVKLNEVASLVEARRYTVAVHVSGVDSFGAELVTGVLAYEKNKLSPESARLHAGLAGRWFLVDRVKAGTSAVDTLWFGMISQHALHADGNLIDIDFEVKDEAGASKALWLVSAKFTARSRPTIAAEVEPHALVTNVDRQNILPKQFVLEPNFPNPFNAGTRVSFQLPVRSHVRIAVTNLMGQQVANLLDQQLEAGYHHIDWNGRGQNGQPAASGIYLYSIQAGDFVQKRKMLLVR